MERLYLLDANVLITANRDYYPVKRVPEFWTWLVHHAEEGRVKVPAEILDEVKRGRRRKGMDDLLDWLGQDSVKDALVLDEQPDPDLVRRVVEEGYASGLTEHELEKLGRDPFLIAYALVEPTRRHIVTTEVSSPKKRRANRKIPDVAMQFGITPHDVFQFTRRLDFRTDWREGGG
ncbi:MAG: DUF4411 family protein [Gemmatimonadetes bacterium]|nr:DUF4411 family protein [Gemmatimonadota bacterium]MYB98207.1 DUF4411 family protein [Gemmatimonadota bacterium]MYI44972.1 DUF4411 family protein [Gemmatimonadota bacterium]